MNLKYYKYLNQENKDRTIWRYMDLSKFKSLIEKNALFLTKVGVMSDRLEGRYPRGTKKSWESAHLHIPDLYRTAIMEHQSEMYHELRKSTYISCWRMDDKPSYHMWDVYAKATEGIAIKSSTRKLYDSLNKFSAQIGLKVFVAKVFYVDYDKQPSANDLLIYQFINKAKEYRHEQEIRAIFMEGYPKKEYNKEALKFIVEAGIGYPVDLNILINEIHISPFATEEVKQGVYSLLQNNNIAKTIVEHENIDIY